MAAFPIGALVWPPDTTNSRFVMNCVMNRIYEILVTMENDLVNPPQYVATDSKKKMKNQKFVKMKCKLSPNKNVCVPTK